MFFVEMALLFIEEEKSNYFVSCILAISNFKVNEFSKAIGMI